VASDPRSSSCYTEGSYRVRLRFFATSKIKADILGGRWFLRIRSGRNSEFVKVHVDIKFTPEERERV
jgi:hypothetical protein